MLDLPSELSMGIAAASQCHRLYGSHPGASRLGSSAVEAPNQQPNGGGHYGYTIILQIYRVRWVRIRTGLG
ncbi:MAG: hypothetical protein Fur0025_14080 [Oscillatoriaceae cyanobacterium]